MARKRRKQTCVSRASPLHVMSMLDPDRHMEFHNRQMRATDELLVSLAPCIPPHWCTPELHLQASWSPITKARSIRHRLLNPSTGEEITDFPERLFGATHALHAICVEFDQNWRGCVVKRTPGAPGKQPGWEINFEYPTM